MLPAWRAEDATLCRYITRPAIANERLTLNRAGDVVLQLKSPYQRDHPCRDVTVGREQGMEADQMQPWTGGQPEGRMPCSGEVQDEVTLRDHPERTGPHLTLQRFILYLLKAGLPPRPVHGDVPHPSAPVRLSFAQLLKRVFGIHIAQGPRVAAVP